MIVNDRPVSPTNAVPIGSVQEPDGFDIVPVTSTRSKFVDGFNGTALDLNNWNVVRNTDMTTTVNNGTLSVDMGITNGAEYLIVGKVGCSIPANLIAVLQMSQRIAGNEVRFGYVEVGLADGLPVAHASLPSVFRNYCALLFSGTTVTACTLEGMSTDAATVRQVAMTGQASTAALAEYSIESRPEDLTASSQTADSSAARIAAAGRISSQCPSPDRQYAPFIWLRNVSAPASATTVTFSRIVSMDIQEIQVEVGGGRGNQAASLSLPVSVVAMPTTHVTVIGAAAATNANGASTHRLVAVAGTNNTSVKATPGRVVGGIVSNTSATWKYLKFYSKNAAPVPGTDVPIFTVPVAPNASVELAAIFDQYGLYCAAGIAYAITGAPADADTTAITAGDVVLSLLFA